MNRISDKVASLWKINIYSILKISPLKTFALKHLKYNFLAIIIRRWSPNPGILAPVKFELRCCPTVTRKYTGLRRDQKLQRIKMKGQLFYHLSFLNKVQILKQR